MLVQLVLCCYFAANSAGWSVGDAALQMISHDCLVYIGIHLGEVLSPKHVAGSRVVAVTGRIMLEVLPIIAADLLGWKEIHPSDTAVFWASRQMLLCLLGRF